MAKRGITYLILMMLFCVSVKTFAEADTNVVTHYKPFNKELIKELQQTETYIYPLTEGEKGLTPWQKFLRWLGNFLSFDINPVWWEYLLYIALFAIFIFAVIKLLGLSVNGIFSRPKPTGALGFNTLQEDVTKRNLYTEIEEALANNNYRLVVRLRYLQALKILAEQELLIIKQGKTNFDYVYELKDGSKKDNFTRLANLFDYVWYGFFEVNEQHLTKSAQYLMALSKQKSEGHA